MGFIFGVILLFLDVWAIVSVLRSPASGTARLAWTAGIIIFPLIGFLAWYFAGPKGGEATA